jgi:hypothetical protein
MVMSLLALATFKAIRDLRWPGKIFCPHYVIYFGGADKK